MKEQESEIRKNIEQADEKMQEIDQRHEELGKKIEAEGRQNELRRKELNEAKQRLEEAVAIARKLQGSTAALTSELGDRSSLR